MKEFLSNLLLLLMTAPLFYGSVFFLLGSWIRERDLRKYEGKLASDLAQNPIEGVHVFFRIADQTRFQKIHSMKQIANGFTLRDFAKVQTLEFEKIEKLVLRKFGALIWLEIYHEGRRFDLASAYTVDMAVLICKMKNLTLDKESLFSHRWISKAQLDLNGH